MGWAWLFWFSKSLCLLLARSPGDLLLFLTRLISLLGGGSGEMGEKHSLVSLVLSSQGLQKTLGGWWEKDWFCCCLLELKNVFSCHRNVCLNIDLTSLCIVKFPSSSSFPFLLLMHLHNHHLHFPTRVAILYLTKYVWFGLLYCTFPQQTISCFAENNNKHIWHLNSDLKWI